MSFRKDNKVAYDTESPQNTPTLISDWINYYSRESPYSCERHELTSYKKTYSDLVALLVKNEIPEKSTILDIGAGTGVQFDLIDELRYWSWVIVEPAEQIHKKNLKNFVHVLELEKFIENIDTNENVLCMTVCSCSQYMKDDQLFALFAFAIKKFPNLSTIILSDVQVGKSISVFDGVVYLINAIRFGWLIPGLLKLAKLSLGNYRTLINKNPLRSYKMIEFENFFHKHKFILQVEKKNLGYNFHRKTLIFSSLDK